VRKALCSAFILLTAATAGVLAAGQAPQPKPANPPAAPKLAVREVAVRADQEHGR